MHERTFNNAPIYITKADGTPYQLQFLTTYALGELSDIDPIRRTELSGLSDDELLFVLEARYIRVMVAIDKILKSKLYWKETGEKVVFSDMGMWEFTLGIKGTWTALRDRIKNRKLERSVAYKILDFLTSDEFAPVI